MLVMPRKDWLRALRPRGTPKLPGWA